MWDTEYSLYERACVYIIEQRMYIFRAPYRVAFYVPRSHGTRKPLGRKGLRCGTYVPRLSHTSRRKEIFMGRYIDADKEKSVIQNIIDHLKERNHKDSGWIIPPLMTCIDIIDEQPTADVTPVVHARWEERRDVNGDAYYSCTACGCDWLTIDGNPADNNMHYCPECGAKMDEEAPHE